jgi:hypothetical protein
MSFEDEIRRATSKIARQNDKVVRGTTIALFNAVIMDTPVDTGRLRGEWQLSVGQATLSENGRVDTSGAEAIAEVASKTPPGVGQETYLSNNMDYAAKIEFEGWSHTKAPQGMVRRNVARFQRLLDEQARGNRS